MVPKPKEQSNGRGGGGEGATTGVIEELAHLRYIVNVANERIEKLEQKLIHNFNEPKDNSKRGESLRMILIGPPGAGNLTCYCLNFGFISLIK